MHGARQGGGRWACAGAFALSCSTATALARADDVSIEGRVAVHGGAADLTSVQVDGVQAPWAALENPRPAGKVELRWTVSVEAGPTRAIEVPTCAGRGVIATDGVGIVAPDAGPVVVRLSPGEHVVSVRVTVSDYERRIACGAPARLGTTQIEHEGLLRLTFDSPHASAGGGRAVVFVPPGHDGATPGPLLVLPHPWNGSVWTYAAYAELLDEAAKRDVVLLLPGGLGNSLYTAPAEDEVLRAIDALASRVAVDRTRVSIAGASMGGAGSTTIGLHSPDRFASITSFFGDSKYDLATYVRAILRDDVAAHRVNALDVVDNARHVPVWLVHGEDDRVSPIAQSEVLARALEARGFLVRFDRVAGVGHSGALFARFARELVDRAKEATAPTRPSRVTYRSVRGTDRGAYGVTLERSGMGDAFVDVERTADGAVHVHRADNVRTITLGPGALGAAASAPVVIEPSAGRVRVTTSER